MRWEPRPRRGRVTGVWVYMVDIVHAGDGGGVWFWEGLEGGSDEPRKKKGTVKRERRPRKRKTSV